MEKIPTSIRSFIWHFVNVQKLGFLFFGITSLVFAVSSAIWPLITGNIIDQLTAQSDLKQLMPLVWGAFGFWVVIEFVTRLRGITFAWTIPKLESNIRCSIFNYVNNHSFSFFSNGHPGGLANRVDHLPTSASMIIDILLTDVFPVIVAIILSSAIFAIINIYLSLALFLWLVTHLFLCFFFSSRAARYSFIKSDKHTTVQARIVDSVNNYLNVKLFNGNHAENEYVKSAQEAEKTAYIDTLFYIEKTKLLLSFISMLGVSGVFYIVFSLWEKNQITIGEIILVITSVLNLMSLLWEMGDEMSYLFKEIGICQQSLGVIHDNYKKEGLGISGQDFVVTDAKIEFQNVSFHYKRNSNLFNNESLTIGGKERIGLVGFSGSGKTTFTSLIMRLNEISGGQIMIDGQDISKVDVALLRSEISLISQEPSLFNRSIVDNIKYSKPDATMQQVIEAAKQANAHDFILKLENGYDTLAGNLGSNLSGGQKQRIAIARSILKEAKIIILDEATSALDSVTEKKVQEAMTSLTANKTTLIIAHKLSTLLDVDKIIVFKEGSVHAIGTHEELLAGNAHYQLLWQYQSAGILPETYKKV